MNKTDLIVCFLLLVVVVLYLCYDIFKDAYIKLKTVNVTSENVNGKVIKKERRGESYLVWVKWNDTEQCFDNKDTWFGVRNQVELILTKKYDKNNVLLEQVLEVRNSK